MIERYRSRVAENQDKQAHSFAHWPEVSLVSAFGLVLALTPIAPEGWPLVITFSFGTAACFLGVWSYKALAGRLILTVLTGLCFTVSICFALLPHVLTPPEGKPIDSPSQSHATASPSLSNGYIETRQPTSDGTSTSEPTNAATQTPPGPTSTFAPPKFADETLQPGKAYEFFDGEVRLALSSTFSSWATINVYNQSASCNSNSMDLGETFTFSNRDKTQVYEVTLMALPGNESASVHVVKRQHKEDETTRICTS